MIERLRAAGPRARERGVRRRRREAPRCGGALRRRPRAGGPGRGDRRGRRRRRARADEHERARPADEGGARGGQARARREADGDLARGGGRALELSRSGARVCSSARRTSCSARPSAPSTRAVRDGQVGRAPQRPRALRLGGAVVERVVLRTGRRVAVRPRRLQRHEPVRAVRAGAAGDGDGRGGDPRARGERPPDPAWRPTTTPTCCSTSATSRFAVGDDGVHDAAVPLARDRAVRQRGNDPAARRRLGARGLGAVAERRRRVAPVPRVGSALAVDRRACGTSSTASRPDVRPR